LVGLWGHCFGFRNVESEQKLIRGRVSLSNAGIS